jgi:hypothetical protein
LLAELKPWRAAVHQGPNTSPMALPKAYDYEPLTDDVSRQPVKS